MDICIQMKFTSELHPPHISLFHIPNIMHEYTETKSKYTGKIWTHSMRKEIYIIL